MSTGLPHWTGLRHWTGLPRWPVLVLLAGYPLWWVSGLLPFLPVLIIVVGGALLLGGSAPRILPGVLPFVAYALWALWCAVAVDAPMRYIAFGMRWAALAGAVLLLVYLTTMRRLDGHRLLGALAVVWMLVVVGGYLGLLWPSGGFRTPMAALVPASILENELVSGLLRPQFAEVQHPWGAPEAFNRPAAPFPYTNSWGSCLALLTPAAFAWRAGSRRRMVRLGVPLIALAAIPPALATRNRGMLIMLVVAVLWYVVRALADRRYGAAWTTLGALAAAGVAFVLGGGAALIAERQTYSDTTTGRGNVYAMTLDAVAQSPLVGFGVPRPHPELDVALGTQGAFWTAVFSYGFVGAALFLLALYGGFLRVMRVPGAEAGWLQGTLAAACVALFFYGFDTTQWIAIVIPLAVLLRRRYADATGTDATGTDAALATGTDPFAATGTDAALAAGINAVPLVPAVPGGAS